ncbi:MAG: response regulator [Bacteriovoracia bacterium]
MKPILYIDDEQDILELAEIYFADLGLPIQTAASAEEGLKLFDRIQHDIIISDARMPGVKGVDLFQTLVTERGFTGKFIIVSGHCESQLSSSLPVGITMVLAKPIDFEELAQHIKAFIPDRA